MCSMSCVGVAVWLSSVFSSVLCVGVAVWLSSVFPCVMCGCGHMVIQCFPPRTKTRILEQGLDVKIRVKTVLHFIAIMKVYIYLHAHTARYLC